MGNLRDMCQVKDEIAATLDNIEVFIAGLGLRLQCLPAEPIAFALELLVRESLVNAVAHGCHEDARRKVRCAIRLRDGRMTIVVRDDGCGFDWGSLWHREAGLAQASGRGLEIIRRYATRVRFNRSGNTIMILKRW